MIPTGSSSNANRGRRGGGSRSRSRHGGGRRGSKDGGDDKRNWPLSIVHTFIDLAFDAQTMRTHVLCGDFNMVVRILMRGFPPFRPNVNSDDEEGCSFRI
jgi:hypothetical protein